MNLGDYMDGYKQAIEDVLLLLAPFQDVDRVKKEASRLVTDRCLQKAWEYRGWSRMNGWDKGIVIGLSLCITLVLILLGIVIL